LNAVLHVPIITSMGLPSMMQQILGLNSYFNCEEAVGN